MALDFTLTDEQKMIQDAVMDLVKKYEGRADELRESLLKKKVYPQELWQDLADRVSTITIPIAITTRSGIVSEPIVTRKNP